MHNAIVQRKKLFKLLTIGISSLVIVYMLYNYFIGSRHVTTENAYVGAEIAQVSSSVNGTVQAIYNKDTDQVTQGELLVVLDDTDAQLSLSRATANLKMADANLVRTKMDYERRTNLANTGSVSIEEIGRFDNALKSAQAKFDEAKISVAQAEIDLTRTKIYSPIKGTIAKRQVQLGQRVQIGTPLMSVVPLFSLHVDANLKEIQLRKVRIGQSVKMNADLYGNTVTYTGKVVGIAGGTGSAFSIIPAQNATGNWIKVVQRLPIRISLDTKQLEKNPLQVGLSMRANIDVSPK